MTKQKIVKIAVCAICAAAVLMECLQTGKGNDGSRKDFGKS